MTGRVDRSETGRSARHEESRKQLAGLYRGMTAAGADLPVIRSFFMLVAGNRAGVSDIQAEDRYRFRQLRQFCTAFFTVGKLREGEGFTGGALDRFWFWRFTAAAIRITRPTHGVPFFVL